MVTTPTKIYTLSYTTLFRSESEQGEKANYPHFYRQSLDKLAKEQRVLSHRKKGSARWEKQRLKVARLQEKTANQRNNLDRKSTRLNSSHVAISYAVFCLK